MLKQKGIWYNVGKFKFHIVQIKQPIKTSDVFPCCLFKFHIVQIKPNSILTFPTSITLFKFHIVQIKQFQEKYKTCKSR